MPQATSTLPETLETSFIRSHQEQENSDVLSCLDHLYMPHGKCSQILSQQLRCLGKGVMLRAGRATTTYLRKATLGAQAIAIVSKIWNIWDGFHKELYLYGHPLHLRPLQGLCVPSIIGVYTTPEGLANMAMEPPHPHAWRVADRSLSLHEKRAIVEAYSQIHSRGVLHRDVALRHMLIGRDGKATIINFRQASCLPPATKIGLSGCGAHEFQLEMRRVKFLLDYQGARESEYRLAREHHYATLVDPRERTSPVTSFPISETTLRQWDASTLEDLRKPLLPYYVPDSPGISLLPVSWVSSEKPLGGGGEDLVHRDSVGEQFHILASPENSIQSRSGQMDDDPLQLPPTQSPTPSSLKRKLVEYDIDSDVVKYALTRKRLHLESSTVDANIVIGKQFPTARNRPPISGPGGQGHHGASASHISWHIHERATLSRPACDASGALQLVAASLDNTLALRALDFIETAPTDQLPFSPLPSHDIEPFSPSSLTSAVSATLSYVSPPGYASQKLYPPRSRNVELEGHYEFTPLLDYALDSSSDSSLAITGASYGNLADTAPFPAKGARAIVTLQGELFPFPVVAYTKIFGPSSEIEVGLPGSSRLEDSRQSYKTNELVPIRYKRKRLFIAYEDNYEGRVHKSRSIE